MRHTTAVEIDKAVREMYRKGGYVVLSQVRNGTGYEKKARTLDMLTVSTWPSRGLFVEGIEIKRDRNDLRRELADPQKADDLARYCTWFWIAVPNDLITPDMMIPDTWGIITVDDKGKASVQRRGKELTPDPMDALLVCSVLRNFSDSYVPIDDVQPKIDAAREEERKSSEARRGRREKGLEEAVAKFKQASGIDLMGRLDHPVWQIERIGEAVRLITSLQESPAEELARAVAALDAAKTALLVGAKAMFPREFAPLCNGLPRAECTGGQ